MKTKPAILAGQMETIVLIEEELHLMSSIKG
jgi:hypothetical protein